MLIGLKHASLCRLDASCTTATQIHCMYCHVKDTQPCIHSSFEVLSKLTVAVQIHVVVFCSAPCTTDARTAAQGLPAASCTVADNDRWTSQLIKDLHFHAALFQAVSSLVLVCTGEYSIDKKQHSCTAAVHTQNVLSREGQKMPHLHMPHAVLPTGCIQLVGIFFVSQAL